VIASLRIRVLIVVECLALLLLAVAVGYYWYRISRADDLAVFADAPAFTLTDQLERPVDSDDFHGKVVVANFIYTSCTDFCPLLSLRMQQLQDRLRAESLLGSQVQLLSFTVDPARDTPAVLRDYGASHQANPDAWRFLTGPPDQVVPLIVDGFHLGVQALPPQQSGDDPHEAGDGHDHSYDVMHSGRFVLIDRQWRVRAYYDGSELDLDKILRDVRQLLARPMTWASGPTAERSAAHGL